MAAASETRELTRQKTPAAADAESFLRHVALERGLARNTVISYRRDLAAYLDWLHGRGIDALGDVTELTVGEFSAALTSRGLSAASVRRMLATVRGLHRFGFAEGRVEADAAREVRPPKLPLRLPKAITVAQVERLLDGAGDLSAGSGVEEAAVADLGDLRDRALLELLYATGARVSEAVALDVDDVIDVELLRLRGKGDKERLVPLGSYARRALDAYLVRARPVFARRAKGTPAVFLGARGARLSRQNAWLVIRRAADRAGLSDEGVEVSPHTLRHSFATHLIEGGADVRVVQELLGHASVATTQLYTLVTIDSLRDVYSQAHPRAR